MSGALKPTIHVVAGALLSHDGQILIAQRPPGKHLAGGWEFPGGKLAQGETSLAALKRELHEELGVIVGDAQFIDSCCHDYDDRRVMLELWLVPEFTGQPQSLDGQALRWVNADQLQTAGMLPADQPLIEVLLRKLA